MSDAKNINDHSSKRKLKKKQKASMLMTLLPLSACGGGGGGGEAPARSAPPIINSGGSSGGSGSSSNTSGTFIQVETNVYAAPDPDDAVLNKEDSLSHLIAVGNHGDDTIKTGSGDDIIYGYGGADTILSGGGNDYVSGGAGADTMNGGTGIDTIDYYESSSAVTVNLATKSGSNGDASGDTIINFENIVGSRFHDTLIGDAGNNLIEGANGHDHIDGGEGFDVVSFFGATNYVNVNLLTGIGDLNDADGDTYSNIEGIFATDYNDILTGDNSSNEIYGFAGNDTIYGNGGGDYLDGGIGDDFIDGGDGNDFIIAYEDSNTINGGDGIDLLTYWYNTTGITVNLETGIATKSSDTDTISNIENVIGTEGNDTIIGDDADNTIVGYVGADDMDGGDGTDTLAYYYSGQGVTINIATGTASGGTGAGDTFTNFEIFHGSDYADTIIGDENDNIIDGYDGNDTINAAGGDDLIYAYSIENGHRDIIDGGTGYDTIAFIGSSIVTPYSVNLAGIIYSNIEEISMSDGYAESITLTADDVIAVTDDDNTLRITGHQTDNITTSTSWTYVDANIIDDDLFFQYTSGAATVNISIEIGNVSGFDRPDESFTETSLNTYTADNNTFSLLYQAHNLSNLKAIGKDGDDLIATGDGDDIVIGGAGDDKIATLGGNDIVWAGEGVDHVSTGDGDDVIVIIGTTGPSDYDNSDITNPAGSGLDLSDVITLADLNNQTVSEVAAGEFINGGAGNNTLVVYGVVDLTGVTLIDINQLTVNSEVTLTTEQMNEFITVNGDGSSVLKIETPNNSDTFILDLSNTVFQNIDSVEINGNVKIIVSSTDALAGISEITNTGTGTLTVELVGDTDFNISDISSIFAEIDTVIINEDAKLIIDDSSSVTDLGISDITGSGIIDASLSEGAYNSLSGVSVDENTGIQTQIRVITIDDVFVKEGDGIATFTVSLDEAIDYNYVKVDYVGPDGSTGTLTFNPGETTKTLDITIPDDDEIEYDSLSWVSLTNPINGNIADSLGRLHIQDDDGVLTNAIAEDILFEDGISSATRTEMGIDAATTLTPGTTIFATNPHRDDKDYYRVDYTTGEEIEIKIDLDYSDPFSVRDFAYQHITDITGEYRTEEIDGDYYIYLSPDADGTFYFGLTATVGYYSVTTSIETTDESAGVPDFDGSIATLGSVDIDTELSGTLYYSDVDFIEVQLEGGKTYKFSADGEEGFNPYFNFYDDSGTQQFEYTYYDGISYRFFTPETTGTYYVSLEQDIGAYTLSYTEIEKTEPDTLADYAGDITTRSTITIDAEKDGTISYRYDEDWHSITLEAGKYYKITGINKSDNDEDLLVEGLYDSTGTAVPYRLTDLDQSQDFKNYISVDTNGEYFIHVSGNLHQATDYGITVTEVTITEADDGDDYASDDTTRATMEVGGSIELNLKNFINDAQMVNDRDAVKIYLEAGNMYHFYTDTGASVTLATEEMYVFNFFNAAIQESGYYYILVDGYDEETTLYAEISTKNEPDGSPDIGDIRTTDTVLSLDDPYDFHIYGRDDVDAFIVNLEAGVMYGISVSKNDPNSPYGAPSYDLRLDDRHGASTPIWQNNYDPEEGEPGLYFTVEESGQYYLEFAPRSVMYGEYTVTLNDLSDVLLEPNSQQDYGNLLSTASLITVNNTYTGTENFDDDPDWFKVNLDAGDVIQITMPRNWDGDENIRSLIYDVTDGSYEWTTGIETDDETTIIYQADTAGTYAFLVEGNSDYTFTITELDLSSDVPDDDTTNLVLNIDSTVQTTIDLPGDYDAVKVDLTAGKTYKLTLWDDNSTYTDGSQIFLRSIKDSSQNTVNHGRFTFPEDTPVNSSYVTYYIMVDESDTYYISSTIAFNKRSPSSKYFNRRNTIS